MNWKTYVKEHYSEVKHLPNKERLKELSKMYREQGGALVSGGAIQPAISSGGAIQPAISSGGRMRRGGAIQPAISSGGAIQPAISSGGALISGGDFKSFAKGLAKQGFEGAKGLAKQGFELAKSEAKKQLKKEVEKFKENPLDYAKGALSLSKNIYSKLKGSGLSDKKAKSIVTQMEKKHAKFENISGGAIPWNWEYLDPSQGISDQLKDAYIKGKVYMHNIGPASDASQLGGDENAFEWNQKYWLMKDEGQRLLNAVQVDNQRRADEPSAAERIATGLVGSVAEGVTKGAMGGSLKHPERDMLLKEYNKAHGTTFGKKGLHY